MILSACYKKKVTKLPYIVLVIILALGFFVRQHNIYTWPRTGATFDEYAWTWLGMNLIQHQVPISWSPHPQYTNRKQVVYQKAYFLIVRPYLEHPPLFGLVAGGYALLTGTKDMFHVNIYLIRG